MRSAADTLLNRLVSTTARVPGIVYKFPFLFSFRKVGEGVVLAPSPDISVIITGISGRAAHLIYRTPLVVSPFVIVRLLVKPVYSLPLPTSASLVRALAVALPVLMTLMSGKGASAHLIYRTPPFVVAWFVGEASVLAPSPGICTTATSFCWFYPRFRPAHSVRISLAPAVAPV